MASLSEVRTEGAPAAIGPYSQAIVHAGTVYTAGQIALSPEGEMVGAGDVAAEARQVMANLAAVLEAAGSGLDRTIRCDVFLIDLAHFDLVNGVYAEAMGAHRPARLTVQVSALPKNAKVEIAAIAAV